MQDLWYKNAVIYCVDVETYMDGNGDGIGDFVGLRNRLDHIAGLGATCIWLLPFYMTPNRDNGYDVSDYYAMDPRLGTFGDFVEFTHLARDKGMRVIADLVINHTSKDHPWFQAAKSDPKSPYRDYYVWQKEAPADAKEGIVFPGVQETTWTWCEEAGAHYFHRFYEHMPDLNFDNPAVREELEKVMGFWVELGVSGFRLDAAPFVVETMSGPEKGKMHFDYFRKMRSFIQWRRGDAVILAEANVTAEEVADYVGDGDRLHMLFNFITNQRLFLSLAREDAGPLVKAMKSLPPMPPMAQWASFLRNHDELDLGRLSDKERQECFKAFAPDKCMQLYDRGIRRRLAPMLGGDRKKMELAYSLMFSLPGTPVIWYGDEIGLGERLDLDERMAVRTPMQWSGEPNAGFSKADPDKLIRPVVEEGPFAYGKVNVALQNRDKDSFLNWMERIVRTRRECAEFGWGEWELLDTGSSAVLGHRCHWRDGTVIAFHNFGKGKARVETDDLCPEGKVLTDLFEDHDYPAIKPGKPFDLNGFGYRWLRVE